MKLNYIKHAVTILQDVDVRILIKKQGVAGYGIYWLLLENLACVENNELEFNLKKLSVLIDAEESAIREVIEESGLFQIKNGVFWSPFVKEQIDEYSVYVDNKRKAIKARWDKVKEKTKEQGSLVAPSETPKPAQTQEPQTNAATTTPQTQEPPQTPAPILTPEVESANDAPAPTAETVDEIVAAWNEVFGGTNQEYRGLALDPIAYHRARETLAANYALNDMRRAFEIAKADDFPWLLRDVLKTDNLQRLLTRGEKNGKTGDNSGKGDESGGNAWGVDWSVYDSGDE